MKTLFQTGDQECVPGQVGRLFPAGLLKRSVVVAGLCGGFLGLPPGSLADALVKYEFSTSHGFTRATLFSEHVSATAYAFSSDQDQAQGLSFGGNPAYSYYCRTLSGATNSYTFFTLTLAEGAALELESVTVDTDKEVDGPATFEVLFSTNGVAFTSLGNGSLATLPWDTRTADNGGVPVTNLTGTVHFRVHGFGWGGSATPPLTEDQNWYHDNITVNGAITGDFLVPARISEASYGGGTVFMTITNLTGGATNIIERSADLGSNDWSMADSFISTTSHTNWSELVSNNWQTIFYRIDSRR